VTHDPQNEDDFVGAGRCPVCRTFDPELLFYFCTCCPTARAYCQRDGCQGEITRTRVMPRDRGGARRLREVARGQRRDRQIAAGREATVVL
jgi:hypothetical protein